MSLYTGIAFKDLAKVIMEDHKKGVEQMRMFDLPPTIHKKENNAESQKWLNENKVKLSNQCQKVWHILCSGKRLTVREAMITYNIGDLRRRIKDLKDQGYEIGSRRMNGGYKEYFT